MSHNITSQKAAIGFALLVWLIASSNVLGQSQTVGLFRNDPGATEGYTLFAPMGSVNTYLVDNYGRLVNTWVSDFQPNQAVCLLENGDLMRTARVVSKGGSVQTFAWDGTLIWNPNFYGDGLDPHHDIAPLPNGNVLVILRSRKTVTQALDAGRDPALLGPNGLNTETIVEIHPTGMTTYDIVWEWRLWDHLIQDYCSSCDNYGVVADHPELPDLNYDFDTRPEWVHFNGIGYNAEFDQIVISARNVSELWVIDHSTTTEEAAGHTGGLRGRGGDLIYRWGNPETYDRGTPDDRRFFLQHDANWVPDGYPGAGNLMVYSNQHPGTNGDYSSVVELTPPVDALGNYQEPVAGEAFGPADPTWTYVADPPESLYSENISGAQRLSSGNTLISAGAVGRLIEVTPSGKQVWEYINPDAQGAVLDQGDPVLGNQLFKSRRYGPDYPGLQGRDLTPGGPIEGYPVAISGVAHTPVDPTELDDVTVTATVEDEVAVTAAELWYDAGGGGFTMVEMFDDGIHGDGAAGDDVYGATIPAQPLRTPVTYYIHAEDAEANGADSPPGVPITVYRYATPGAGLNQTGLTLFDRQSNYPELYENTVPTPGYPWTWTVTDIDGFAGAPALWFVYSNDDHTSAGLQWSGFDAADWETGTDGTFELTLSNGVDADIVYTVYLSLRSMVSDGYTIFRNQIASGSAITADGVYGFKITTDQFDWGGSTAPTTTVLTFDTEGHITELDFGDGPWSVIGACRFKLQDGNRPPSYITDQVVSLNQIVPDTLTVVNNGEAGAVLLQVDGDAAAWDWSAYTDGLANTELTAPDATGASTFVVSWDAGALVDDETGLGSITMHCAGSSAPAAVVAIPTLVRPAGCCVGRVGDVNSTLEDEPTVGDISTLIDVLFISNDWNVIACMTEADVNQSGGLEPTPEDISIGDISVLIDYLFITGPTLGLPNCL